MGVHAIFPPEPYVPQYVDDCEQEADGIVSWYERQPMNDRAYDWQAIPSNYDGAPDSHPRHKARGWGATRTEAIEDLKAQLEECE